jgi:hypothetical protein
LRDKAVRRGVHEALARKEHGSGPGPAKQLCTPVELSSPPLTSEPPGSQPKRNVSYSQ